MEWRAGRGGSNFGQGGFFIEMPPRLISLGSSQLMFVVTCSVPDAATKENAKAPEMRARRPKSSLPPVLGTESKYLLSSSRQPQH